MLFASFDFLLFLSAVFAVYWALGAHTALRASWVLAASYFFYMAGPRPLDGPLPAPWYFAGLLLLSTMVDYASGLAIAAAQRRAGAAGISAPGAATEAPARAGRFWLLLSLLTNLGLLGYFKYTGFLLEVVSDAAAMLGADFGLPALQLLLPVGISFYTFQSLSYTIDVYRGRIPAERSFLKLALFIAFFPQLVAGPIVRASEFLPQLVARPSLTRADVDFAIFRIVKGLVKKVVLGDFIAASFSDRVFASPAEFTSLENLLALYAFTLQIYADFSGYSDMAIGTARLFGFRIPENFNRPYQAVDVSDFWRRWHITLSTWLRDYVYYPLGGNRVSVTRSYVNLWVTMFLVGIWHGASWNFVIYAALQATAMVYSRYCRQRAGSALTHFVRLFGASAGIALLAALLASTGLGLDEPWTFGLVGGILALAIGLLPAVERWPAIRPLHVLLTLHFSVLTRVFFRAESLESARAMAGKLIGWDGLGVREGLFRIEGLARWLEGVGGLAWLLPVSEWGILLLLIFGFSAHYLPARRVEVTAERLVARVPAVLIGVGLAALFGAMSLLLAGPRPNIYFAF